MYSRHASLFPLLMSPPFCWLLSWREATSPRPGGPDDPLAHVPACADLDGTIALASGRVIDQSRASTPTRAGARERRRTGVDARLFDWTMNLSEEATRRSFSRSLGGHTGNSRAARPTWRRARRPQALRTSLDASGTIADTKCSSRRDLYDCRSRARAHISALDYTANSVDDPPLPTVHGQSLPRSVRCSATAFRTAGAALCELDSSRAHPASDPRSPSRARARGGFGRSASGRIAP